MEYDYRKGRGSSRGHMGSTATTPYDGSRPMYRQPYDRPGVSPYGPGPGSSSYYPTVGQPVGPPVNRPPPPVPVSSSSSYKLGAMLATHWDKPRAYIGCMKSGEVFSNPSHKWYEPESWKFGDGKSYFRHASGEMYVVSRAVAQFISINNYAHEDISVGSWMLGLSVKHIDESQLCFLKSTQGGICATG